MALSLIAYFCVVMSVLAVIVTLLGAILPPHRFPEPHARVFAEAAKPKTVQSMPSPIQVLAKDISK